MSDLLTPQDVARLLRVSVRTVRRLRDRGKLPGSVMVGRQLRWRAASIETWLRRGEK